MKVNFKADKPQNWLDNISKQLDTVVKNGRIVIPSHLGSGVITQSILNENLTLTVINVVFKNKVQAKRLSSGFKDCLPIIFFYSDTLTKKGRKKTYEKIGYKSKHGVFFASHQITSDFYLPAKTPIIIITISINKKWFGKNEFTLSKEAASLLASFAKKDNSFYIYEEIDNRLKSVLDSILVINNINGFDSILLQSKALELIYLFFHRIFQRETSPMAKAMNETDVKQIFAVKELILSDPAKRIFIREISKQVGMSESNLHKKFKQIFGKSIYQLQLEAKMTEAKKLLDTGKHTISQVGYELGYSNLSHFTKAFKKQFEITPSEYIS